MLVLRRGLLRRLCAWSVRPYSSSEAVGEVASEGDDGGQASLRDHIRTRTRSRVEGRLKQFLEFRPPGEVWGEHPPQDAYYLLRNCGEEMILETPASRLELVDKMWAEFQKRGPLPVSLYNTLLMVYLQNGFEFDPIEFMENMEKEGVVPNQGTLVHFLWAYSDRGNIEGATKILSHMRSLDMEISENVYAALITGHYRSGDMDSAEGMLDVMSQNGLTPTVISYGALLCGHAERGDMDKIEELLRYMRGQRIFPSISVYTNILDRLSACSHSDKLPRALDLVHNKQWIYNDLYELACKFIVRGDTAGSLAIVRCMGSLAPRTPMQLGAILARTLAKQGKGLEEMLGVVHELHSLGFGRHTHEELLHEYHLREEDKGAAMEDALTVIRDMHHHGVPVREHYFYPLLAYYAEQKDLDGAVRCVEVMKDIGLKMRKLGFHYLLLASSAGEEGRSWRDASALLSHLEGTPLAHTLANEMCVHLLEQGHLKRVPHIISSSKSDDLMVGQILKTIKNVVKRSHSLDMEGLVQVYVSLKSLQPPPDIADSVVITTKLLAAKSVALAKEFVEQLSRSGIEPGETVYHILLQAYAKPDTAKEFHALVKSLESRGVVLRPSIHKQILQLASDMGDPVRAGQAVSALKMRGELLSATAYSRYIIANAKARRIGTALELYEKMRSNKLRPSYLAMQCLMQELLHWGDLQGAESIRKDHVEMGYSLGLSLRNAFLGAYARRDMDRAIAEFEEHKASDVNVTSFTYNELMVGYSLHGDTERIRELFEELQNEGLSLDRSLVSRLFEAYLVKGDMNGALAVVAEFPALPPNLSSLVTALELAIEQGDQENEQRVVALVTEVGGEQNSQNVLLFAFLKAGQLERAREVAQRKDFALNGSNFITFVRDMRNSRRGQGVYPALELLKEGGHHLGDNSTFWLRVYDILGDAPAALTLQEELEASGHKPSQDFQKYLLAILQRNGYVAPPPGGAAGRVSQ